MGSAVAVNVIVAGLKLTPTGASPPAVGVATTVLVPGVGPRIQQTPALPLRLVVVAAVDPKVPQVRVPEASGAVVPPPKAIAQPTGTPCKMVPCAVLSVTPGRHSGSTGCPTTASAAMHTPPTTGFKRPPGVPAILRAIVRGPLGDAGGAWATVSPRGWMRNSVTVPPTPPEKLNTGSTGANGLNSVTSPPMPPANRIFAYRGFGKTRLAKPLSQPGMRL